MLEVRVLRPASGLVAVAELADEAIETPGRSGRRRLSLADLTTLRSSLRVAILQTALRSVDASTEDVFDEARDAARRLAQLPTDGSPVARTPWEDKRGSRLRRWAQTVATALFRPQRFFGELSAERWGGAVSFAAVQLTLASVAAAVRGRPFEPTLAPPSLEAIGLAFLLAWPVAGLLLGCLVVSMWISAQVSMRRRVRWTGIARVVAYGTAPMVWVFVPVIGWPVALGWSFALHVVGLRRMLGIPWPISALCAATPWLAVLTVLALLAP